MLYKENIRNTRWSLPCLFNHIDVLRHYLIFTKTYDDYSSIIKNVYGSPVVSWNGGRMTTDKIDYQLFEDRVNEFNENGISVNLTFNRYDINENELNDPICNKLLQLLQTFDKQNGVIISSELLYNHITKNYSRLNLISSSIKVSYENGYNNIEYYNNLIDRFDRVIIHPIDNFNDTILTNISPDDIHKVEILVNENCLINCQNRNEHYTLMGNFFKSPHNTICERELDLFNKYKCKSITMEKQVLDNPQKIRNLNLTFNEYNRIYEYGIRNFKLQGRSDDKHQFLYDLCRYTLEPNFVAPLFTKTL